MRVSLKKFAAALAVCAILLAGCAKTPPEGRTAVSGDGSFTIAASFYPLYIMALNVAGNIPGVSVVSMTQPTAGCLHDYSATPDDMKKLEDADCLVVNGAGMESFLDKVAAQRPELNIIEASRSIPLIKGEGGAEDNPHLWVSISNCILQVRNIEAGLIALDDAHAGQYKKNADAYVGKLEALRDRMHRALDGLPNRDIITFHEAFPYFAQEFNLNIAGVIEREPGSEPSAKELADTVETIHTLGIKALFAEPQYPSAAAGTIARETGATVYVLDPAVVGPDDPDAYLDIMEKNMGVLTEALK